LALPPSEVIKMVKVFDFNAKYKPGASRKRIPVDTTLEINQEIQRVIADVFQQLGINVCVRIDGFLTPEGTILLHDPNTIPGMSPTSFIFKQMAEIGLNVTQALTYLVRQSLRERIRSGKHTWQMRSLLELLDEKIKKNNSIQKPSELIVFEPTDEQYAAARLKYGRMNAEAISVPVPVLHANDGNYYKLTNPLMFKEFVADIEDLLHQERHPLLTETSQKAAEITAFYGGNPDFQIGVYTSLAELEVLV
jgi:D-alanine-D-alanine ligase